MSTACAAASRDAAMHARLMRAPLVQRLGEEDLPGVGGSIAWLRLPARFQHAANLEHHKCSLKTAGLE